MKRSFLTPFMGIFFLLLLVSAWTCAPTYRYKQANLLDINHAILNENRVQLLDAQNREYLLTITSVDSSDVSGFGKVRPYGGQSWQDWRGSVPLDSIRFVRMRGHSFLKGVIMVGTVAILIKNASQIVESQNPTMEPKITYPSGSGESCPFIYAHNGRRYVLEGEAFSVAMGRALEMTTRTLLPDLAPLNGKLRVELSNERLETHYINRVNLLAADIPAARQAVLDNFNHLMVFSALAQPAAARDASGRDIRKQTALFDGQFWQTGSKKTASGRRFEDRLEFRFPAPDTAHQATLVVRAINTELSAEVFRLLSRFLGNQTMAFVAASESDPALIARLKSWQAMSSLRAAVLTASGWQAVGAIFPEANEVPFRRAIHFLIPETAVRPLRVRLTSLSDVWKIDGVGIAWDAEPVARTLPVPLLSASGPQQSDSRQLIRQADAAYVTLLPPQKLQLVFAAPAPAPPGKQRVYVLDVRGYLHEWMPPEPAADNGLFRLVPDRYKLAILKWALRHPGIFLPPVYRQWQARRRLAALGG